ncbi:hypothetical protein BMS3Bbin04_00523 [bacterium BMS3Bbin04]|nr:hypothetical protein BMS3Bbin04_00523 [bacterium BMS3Bbin04]
MVDVEVLRLQVIPIKISIIYLVLAEVLGQSIRWYQRTGKKGYKDKPADIHELYPEGMWNPEL